METLRLHTMPPFNYMSILLNKQIILAAAILSPITLLLEKIGQDSFYMMLVLIILVLLDTAMGVYIAWENGELRSGTDKEGNPGFSRIIDKMISYFGLIILTYSIVILTYAVPIYNISRGTLPIDPVIVIKYFVAFSFSIMYGREILSIFESIDRLQPKLLPPSFKRFIKKVFKRDLP
jgi:uncharacterized membrane protein